MNISAVRDTPTRDWLLWLSRRLLRVEGRTFPAQGSTSVSIVGGVGLQIIEAVGADASALGVAPASPVLGHVDRTGSGKGSLWCITVLKSDGTWDWMPFARRDAL